MIILDSDLNCARTILAEFAYTSPPADYPDIARHVANHIAAHRNRIGMTTPDATLPPLDPTGPRRKMVVEIEVSADFEKRLDNQWMVEREIHADRWSWGWADDIA